MVPLLFRSTRSIFTSIRPALPLLRLFLFFLFFSFLLFFLSLLAPHLSARLTLAAAASLSKRRMVGGSVSPPGPPSTPPLFLSGTAAPPLPPPPASRPAPLRHSSSKLMRACCKNFPRLLMLQSKGAAARVGSGPPSRRAPLWGSSTRADSTAVAHQRPAIRRGPCDGGYDWQRANESWEGPGWPVDAREITRVEHKSAQRRMTSKTEQHAHRQPHPHSPALLFCVIFSPLFVSSIFIHLITLHVSFLKALLT